MKMKGSSAAARARVWVIICISVLLCNVETDSQHGCGDGAPLHRGAGEEGQRAPPDVDAKCRGVLLSRVVGKSTGWGAVVSRPHQ